MASYEPFQECISLSDRPLSESYDLELALRFLIFTLIDEQELLRIGDVGVFITEKMRIIAADTNFNKVTWEALFKKTFDFLSKELSDESFKRFSISKNKFTGGFLLSQFEVVAYGIGFNINKNVHIKNVSEKAASIWSNNQYTDWSGSGITATRRLPKILPFGREVFSGGN